MSVQASSWVIEHSQHKGSALLVLLMIANHAHADGTNAFPSIETLAKECRMSDRQITRIIQGLEASGELKINRSAGRFSHRYSLPLMPLNSDKLSGFKYQPNPDKSRTNPDKSRTNPDIAMSPEPSLEPSLEPPSNNNKRARATVLPEDFTPDEPPKKLKDSFTQEQLGEEFEQFRDHHTAKGSKFTDWQAAWRTWLRNAVKFRGNAKGRARPQPTKSQTWDGDSQLDAPGYMWKPRPLSWDEKVREVMDATGWERDAAIAELTRNGYVEPFTGTTKAA
jgi:hypothetical protein